MSELFSNGTEFMVWHETNCQRCSNEDTCPLLNEIMMDQVSAEAAARLQLDPQSSRPPAYCPEMDRPQRKSSRPTARPSLTLGRIETIIHALETLAAAPPPGVMQTAYSRQQRRLMESALIWARRQAERRRKTRPQIHIEEIAL